MQPEIETTQQDAARREEPEREEARRSSAPDVELGQRGQDDEHDGGFGDGRL